MRLTQGVQQNLANLATHNDFKYSGARRDSTAGASSDQQQVSSGAPFSVDKTTLQQLNDRFNSLAEIRNANQRRMSHNLTMTPVLPNQTNSRTTSRMLIQKFDTQMQLGEPRDSASRESPQSS